MNQSCNVLDAAHTGLLSRLGRAATLKRGASERCASGVVVHHPRCGIVVCVIAVMIRRGSW